MDEVGVADFMNVNLFAQGYRDVPVGPFMQPHPPTKIRGKLEQAALGLYSEV